MSEFQEFPIFRNFVPMEAVGWWTWDYPYEVLIYTRNNLDHTYFEFPVSSFQITKLTKTYSINM